MVLVWVALYTYLVNRRQQQKPDEENDNNSNNHDNDPSLNNLAAQYVSSARRQVETVLDTTSTSLLSCYNPDYDKSSEEAAVMEAARVVDWRNEPNANANAPAASSSSSSSTSTPAAAFPNDVFRDDVRTEWINAVFGPDFLSKNNDNAAVPPVPRQGMGLAGIPSYLTYSVTIPSSAQTTNSNNKDNARKQKQKQQQTLNDDDNNNNNKLGMTICRLPLGLYVRKVEKGSEAFLAGIPEGSILVNINGTMNFLAEPSRQALERIWQYEGQFRSKVDNNTTRTVPPFASSSEETKKKDYYSSTQQNAASVSSTAVVEEEEEGVITTPVALTFIRGGKLFQVVMLSNPPWGISWAPCGNFALVKRVYSHAARAGVKKGSLLASVGVGTNKSSFRTMDHAAMALGLRSVFEQQDDNIHLTLCFTPAAARTGHYERMLSSSRQEHRGGAGQRQIQQQSRHQMQLSNQKNSRQACSTTHDGVEVRFHPIEHAILGSLCHAAGVVNNKNISSSSNSSNVHHQYLVVQEMADKVAAGVVEAPTGFSRVSSQQRLVQDKKLLGSNSGSSRKLYAECPVLSAEGLFEVWDPLVSLLYCLRFHAAHYDEQRFATAVSQNNTVTAETPIESLGRLTSMADASDMVGSYLLQFIGIICSPGTSSVWSDQSEEKKIDEATTASMSNKIPRKTAQDLTSMLLKVSRKDEGFCQRLYFLLRSYISTLETPRRQQQHSWGKENGSRNLMALLHCLELLRFAEKQLSGRVVNNNETIELVVANKRSGDPADVSVASSKASASVTTADPPTPPAAAAPRSPSRESHKSKKKGIFGRFRKKKVSKRAVTSPQRVSSPQRAGLSNSEASPSRVRRQHKKGAPGPSDALVLPQSTPALSVKQSPSVMYENMSEFLGELDRVCGTIERSLQKSFRQKMADWAMQPWSPSKDSALAAVTETMRQSLRDINNANSARMLLVNPVNSSELLCSVDYDECYILPSAHFPILLTFNVSERQRADHLTTIEERLYRTKVELVTLKGSKLVRDRSYVIQAAVAGTIAESGKSRRVSTEANTHVWKEGGLLAFETRSTWGAPQTLSIRLSSKSQDSPNETIFEEAQESGYGWLDLSKQFNNGSDEVSTKIRNVEIWAAGSAQVSFDEHGYQLLGGTLPSSERVQLKLKVTTESVRLDDSVNERLSRKRMLLYKHDDDLRQEAFAVQFVKTCDDLLKASGLHLNLLTFQCIPVGTTRGFVEWVPGSVPLSEICQPFAGSILGNNDKSTVSLVDGSPSMFTKAGLTKYESLRRLGGGQQHGSMQQQQHAYCRGSFANNPIQDYLRNVAYDPTAPYFIRKDVMDTYVKSCAGYSVITYILGVGDRHLDNLLLHQSGSFFHCDYSFILGSDPKTYLPVRVTEDMVYGMGDKDSDNYAKFLSMVGATFLALRQPKNVRILLSMVRLMEFSCVPDISENQTTEQALMGIRDRLRLELSEKEAVAYIEGLVESSQSSKMWIAVDAIHSLGKKF